MRASNYDVKRRKERPRISPITFEILQFGLSFPPPIYLDAPDRPAAEMSSSSKDGHANIVSLGQRFAEELAREMEVERRQPPPEPRSVSPGASIAERFNREAQPVAGGKGRYSSQTRSVPSTVHPAHRLGPEMEEDGSLERDSLAK